MDKLKLLRSITDGYLFEGGLLPWIKDAPSSLIDSIQKSKEVVGSKDIQDFTQQKLYALIFASNAIEGSKLSKGDTIKLVKSLEGKSVDDILSLVPDGKWKHASPPDRREVSQHFLALCKLCREPIFPLTEEMIKEVHGILARNMQDDEGRDVNAGKYRTEGMSAGNHTFPDPKSVPSAMTTLVQRFNIFYQEGLDGYLLAGWLMAEFVTVHPFDDGNGRMCRLLFNYALRLKGLLFYIPVTVEHDDRKQYMNLLRRYQRSSAPPKYAVVWIFVLNLVEDAWRNLAQNCVDFPNPE